ncbi:MAG: RluA family pseudouridine synthase [Candidatus Dormibacteria bacterium]
MSPPIEHAVNVRSERAGERLDVFLAHEGILPSRAVAARLAREGSVTVNGRAARASRVLATGDHVGLVVPPPAPSVPTAEAIDLDVRYQDEDLLVVNKPAGMVVHPGAGRMTGTLVNALLALSPDWPSLGGAIRPGIVHRLDRGTSGLMLVARSEVALRRLAADLAQRKVSRTYRAVCRGEVTQAGLVEGPIGRDPRERKRMAVVEGGRAASTTFTPLEVLRGATLLEVELGSGRTHQVRVHLSAIDHPLIGDTTYGGPGSIYIDRPALHAHRLRFQHPRTAEPMDLSVEPPADFLRLVAEMRA